MILNESEQVKGEVFKPTERIKLYVIEVKRHSATRVSPYPEAIQIW